MPGISISHISKSYGKIKAVDDVSFEVAKGEIFGLIGPDGAGKTTLLRILTTVMRQDAGAAIVDDTDISDYKAVRNKVGYMPGRFSLYQDLSVTENLKFYATVFGANLTESLVRINDIYKHLEHFKTRRAGTLSGGMKQKLALCCALIHEPVALFLDEPTRGVDPISRKDFWEILMRLKADGITIIVSTTYMDEANMCDRIALIQRGHILKIDKPAAVASSLAERVWAVKSEEMYRLIMDLQQYPDALRVYTFGEFAHYIDKRGGSVVEDVKNYLLGRGHKNIYIREIPSSIEDSFIELEEPEAGNG